MAASGLRSQLIPPRGEGGRLRTACSVDLVQSASVSAFFSPVQLPLLFGGQHRSFLTGPSRLAPRRPPFEAARLCKGTLLKPPRGVNVSHPAEGPRIRQAHKNENSREEGGGQGGATVATTPRPSERAMCVRPLPSAPTAPTWPRLLCTPWTDHPRSWDVHPRSPPTPEAQAPHPPPRPAAGGATPQRLPQHGGGPAVVNRRPNHDCCRRSEKRG